MCFISRIFVHVVCQSIPPIIKIFVTQRFPSWVKPLFWGVVWAAVAGLVMVARNHISISLRVTLK